MTTFIAQTTLRMTGRKLAKQVVGIVAALGLATACTTSDSGGPSNQAMGTLVGAAVGGTVGGLAFGSAGGVIGGALVGALAGNLVGRALDNQERARLAQATQTAFTAETNVPTNYTVEPTTRSTSSMVRRMAGLAITAVTPRKHTCGSSDICCFTYRRKTPAYEPTGLLVRGRGPIRTMWRDSAGCSATWAIRWIWPRRWLRWIASSTGSSATTH